MRDRHKPNCPIACGTSNFKGDPAKLSEIPGSSRLFPLASHEALNRLSLPKARKARQNLSSPIRILPPIWICGDTVRERLFKTPSVILEWTKPRRQASGIVSQIFFNIDDIHPGEDFSSIRIPDAKRQCLHIKE